MICPNCDGPTKLTGKVYNGDEDELYRRHKCKKCGNVFFTVEFDVEPDSVFKKAWRKYGNFGYKKGGL